MSDERQLINRFAELAARAEKLWCRTHSEFLTLAEQETLCRAFSPADFTLEGGYPNAERCIALFGEEDGGRLPITCLHIAPRAVKFADELSHRDFLGALMSLGIRREVLGDICVAEKQAWLLCLDSIADYICEQLTQVRHTAVSVTRVDALPEIMLPQPESRSAVVASERLDAMIAAVYNLSRSESQALFRQAKVFVNSRVTANSSAVLQPGNIVSVRGYGRFRYEGIDSETRKGRLRVFVTVY